MVNPIHITSYLLLSEILILWLWTILSAYDYTEVHNIRVFVRLTKPACLPTAHTILLLRRKKASIILRRVTKSCVMLGVRVLISPIETRRSRTSVASFIDEVMNKFSPNFLISLLISLVNK